MFNLNVKYCKVFLINDYACYSLEYEVLQLLYELSQLSCFSQFHYLFLIALERRYGTEM